MPATIQIATTKQRQTDVVPSEITRTDYSDEAIPERDPAYRTLDGTVYEAQTVDDMPAEVRRALARCLEQLGMSPSRAALVVSL
jgi:hypothetical protein